MVCSSRPGSARQDLSSADEKCGLRLSLTPPRRRHKGRAITPFREWQMSSGTPAQSWGASSCASYRRGKGIRLVSGRSLHFRYPRQVGPHPMEGRRYPVAI